MIAISDHFNHSRFLLTVPAALMAVTLGASTAQARLVNIEAGLISSAIQANVRCNQVANENDGDWQGRWWTTPAQISYCQIEVSDAPVIAPPPPPRNNHQGGTRQIDVGVIWNSDQANQRCSALARSMGAEWTGQWTTSSNGKTSFCEIQGGNGGERRNRGEGRPNIREIAAGPIRDDRQAQRRCTRIAEEANGSWTGEWRNTGRGGEAVCSVELQSVRSAPPRPRVEVDTVYVDRTPPRGQNVREVNAGPIWDQSQASTKCPYIASTQNGSWTGKWRKLGPDHQSVCEVRFPG